MATSRLTRSALFGLGLLLTGCGDGEAPTAVAEDRSLNRSGRGMEHMMAATVAPAGLEPFTFRASLDPYFIQQTPDFMMRSKATSDIVIQQAVFAPGAGPWHTHPGPSFVYVIEGEIKVDRVTAKDGCTESPVYGTGSAYFEIANEVHRAVVVSAEPAVLLVTRFNIPVGQPFTFPAPDPGC